MRLSCYRDSQASCHVAKRSAKWKRRAGLSGTPLILSPIPASGDDDRPISPPADAGAVGVPPAARTRAYNNGPAIEASASAAIEATTAAAIEATATAIASSAASVRLCRRSRRANQNGRAARHVDEQQSQRCKAAGQDIVAFSHSRISRSLPSIWTSALSHLDARESLRFRCGKTIFSLRFFRGRDFIKEGR
ncbi:hypothetical protein V1279_003150 [Bradyrhizobium sp. AZCC 1610]